MRPAASRAGPPPLSALIPIEKNGSPQGGASRPTASRDAAIRFIVRDPPGPRLHAGYGTASPRGRALTKRRRWARSVRGRKERLDADAAEVSDAHAGRMSAKAIRFDAPSPVER